MTPRRGARHTFPATHDDAKRRAALVERLLQPPLIANLSYRALKTVAALRLVALCRHAERDPLLELAQRFSSITAARAYLAFAERVAACWPEDVMVLRPCCRIVSPDELALAQMADTALAGDRTAFGGVLDGLVRRDRHDRLFDCTTRMVAELH